jgi:hypothetical protein
MDDKNNVGTRRDLRKWIKDKLGISFTDWRRLSGSERTKKYRQYQSGQTPEIPTTP